MSRSALLSVLLALDTRTPGNASTGHDYGAALSPDARRDLVEYLKSL